MKAQREGTLGAREQKLNELGRIMASRRGREKKVSGRGLWGAAVASSRCMIALVITSVNKIIMAR